MNLASYFDGCASTSGSNVSGFALVAAFSNTLGGKGMGMNRQDGFTLIELMIVVAIIAILAAIALPAYQDYLARSQVAESLSLSRGAQLAVAEYYSENGTAPADNADAGLAAPGSIKGTYVSSVTVGNEDGRITILFGSDASSKISGESLVMELTTQEGSLTWDCGGLDAKYLPSACRD